MNRSLGMLAAVMSVVLVGEVRAQEGFAASEISRIQVASSAAAYSTDRIRNNVYNSAMPRYGFGGAAAGTLFGGATSRASKPFSSISRGPSVTPYLALDQPFTNSATNYYTLIRPQLEQQRINQQMERQTQLMQRQISQVTSRPPYDPQGSETMAPTGHGSVFMNYGSYYTAPAPRRR